MYNSLLSNLCWHAHSTCLLSWNISTNDTSPCHINIEIILTHKCSLQNMNANFEHISENPYSFSQLLLWLSFLASGRNWPKTCDSMDGNICVRHSLLRPLSYQQFFCSLFSWVITIEYSVANLFTIHYK